VAFLSIFLKGYTLFKFENLFPTPLCWILPKNRQCLVFLCCFGILSNGSNLNEWTAHLCLHFSKKKLKQQSLMGRFCLTAYPNTTVLVTGFLFNFTEMNRGVALGSGFWNACRHIREGLKGNTIWMITQLRYRLSTPGPIGFGSNSLFLDHLRRRF